MKTIVGTLALLLAGFPARGQSSAEVNAGIQYNFSSPGARSLGRAGAFIADASDATAAYANPAGLVNLPRGEMSIEGRTAAFTNAYSASGHAFGPASGVGNDNVSGIQIGHATNRERNVSFASVVVPLERFSSARRFTIAAYFHELANFAASQATNGVFFDLIDPKTAERTPGYREFPAVSSLRLRIAGEGIAVAFRLSPRFSFGAGLRSYQSTIDSVTRRYGTQGGTGDPDYTDLQSIQRQHGRATSIGINAGALIDLTPKVSVGASYRQGFSFPVAVDYSDFVPYNVSPQTPGMQERARPTQTGAFNAPTFYGVGTSFRPTDNWSIAADVNRITYSDTTRGFVNLFSEEPRYFVPDGTEIRLGSELLLTRDRFAALPFPVSIAAGVWRDPDHSIRAADPADSQAVFFRKTSADIHITGGVGVLLGTKAQLHAAIDHSSRQTVVSMSAMARF
jgi:long-subunit fatty acid transport protein